MVSSTIISGKGTLQDVYVLYQFVRSLPRLLQALGAHAPSPLMYDEGE